MALIKILIVEDDVVISERLAQQLTNLGFEIVDQIRSGHEVIEAVDRLSPDIILLDIVLKGTITGIQVAKILQEKNINTPIIYLTAYSDRATIEQVIKTNPAYFLPKPYTIKNLTVAIDYALSKSAILKTKGESVFQIQDSLFLRKKDQYEKVLVADILWIEASRSSIVVVTNAQNKYVLPINLKMFLSQFSHPKLIRVHRSYIIQVDSIQAIKGRNLVIQGVNIPYSNHFISDINKLLKLIKTRT